jgi:3-deoxy-D-manno-octulosonic-acid transferase
LLRQRGVAFARRSQPGSRPDRSDVFLLDTIGELGRAYRLGTAAVLGGSLVATGGHNPLEPAAWGVPVLSGPHVDNFQEVYDEMVAAGGARLVADPVALATALAEWLSDPTAAAAAGDAARRVVATNRGATARTVDALLELMDRDGA